jgi:hypothetical protein
MDPLRVIWDSILLGPLNESYGHIMGFGPMFEVLGEEPKPIYMRGINLICIVSNKKVLNESMVIRLYCMVHHALERRSELCLMTLIPTTYLVSFVDDLSMVLSLMLEIVMAL